MCLLGSRVEGALGLLPGSSFPLSPCAFRPPRAQQLLHPGQVQVVAPGTRQAALSLNTDPHVLSTGRAPPGASWPQP